MFNSERPECDVDLKEVLRRVANLLLLSLFRAAERDLVKIEAADNTALVEGIVDDDTFVLIGRDVVVVLVTEGILNRLLNGLLNGSLVLTPDELINGTENELTGGAGDDVFVNEEDELPEIKDETMLIKLLLSVDMFALITLEI